MKKIKEVPAIYIAGDSTASDKPVEVFPEKGWGQMIGELFIPDVTIHNYAKNGRSSKSFIDEGHLSNIAENIKPKDYLFIQFGHNDSKPEKERYTHPNNSYKEYLMKYVNTAQRIGAIPVLLTSIHRRNFNKEGKIINTHESYHKAMFETARLAKVVFLDIGEESRILLETLGPKRSKSLFMNFEAGIYPNYPNGKEDNTHFTEEGALQVAQIVVREIKHKIPKLVEYLY